MWITVRLRNVVSSRPAVVLCSSWLWTTWPRALPGPRGAALLWGPSPAGPSSSAPYPLEGPVRGLCPGPGSGKHRARQLRRSTRKYPPSGRLRWPRAGHRPILSRHEGRAFEPIMRACCCLSRRWPGLRTPRRQHVNVAACWIPILRGGWACPRYLARPGPDAAWIGTYLARGSGLLMVVACRSCRRGARPGAPRAFVGRGDRQGGPRCVRRGPGRRWRERSSPGAAGRGFRPGRAARDR